MPSLGNAQGQGIYQLEDGVVHNLEPRNTIHSPTSHYYLLDSLSSSRIALLVGSNRMSPEALEVEQHTPHASH